MSVQRAADSLWQAHLDSQTTREVLEQKALQYAKAKQASRDRRDKWKMRRLCKSRGIDDARES
jgi:hypothetical protein